MADDKFEIVRFFHQKPAHKHLSRAHKLLWSSLRSQLLEHYRHYRRVKHRQPTEFRLHWARNTSFHTSRALNSGFRGARRCWWSHPPAKHLIPAGSANQNEFRDSIGVRILFFGVAMTTRAWKRCHPSSGLHIVVPKLPRCRWLVSKRKQNGGLSDCQIPRVVECWALMQQRCCCLFLLMDYKLSYAKTRSP